MSDPTSPAPAPPDTASRPRFRIPADYYASPDTPRALFSRAVPRGCGIAAVAFLLLIFIAGAIVARNGLGRLMDPVLGMLVDELKPMYAKDVTPAEQKALADEITRLRENIRTGKVPVARLERVMSALREDIRDQQVTRAEAQNLTKLVHDTNAAALAPGRGATSDPTQK